MDCSLPGSSVHVILQARILEWVAISLSRRSSWSGDWTSVSYVSCRLWVAQSQTPLKWLSSSSSSCCIGKLVESGYKCQPYLWQVLLYKGFPDSSVGQESACNAGDPSSNPGSERYLLEKDKLPTPVFLGFACGSAGKEPADNAGDLGLIPGMGRSPGNGMATHSSILAWRISGFQRVRHNWVTFTIECFGFMRHTADPCWLLHFIAINTSNKELNTSWGLC